MNVERLTPRQLDRAERAIASEPSVVVQSALLDTLHPDDVNALIRRAMRKVRWKT